MNLEDRRLKNYILILIAYWTSFCLSETTVDPRSLPRFLDQVPNITKTVGRDALLTCNVDQLKGYKVAWVQVDTQTILTIHKQVITRNPRISLLHDDHRSWHLQIKNLQEDDRGFYMCQVNTDPMRSIKGYLDVVVPPDIIDKESSGDLIVLEGDDVTLKCKAKGHPEPSIVWRRENNEDIVLDADKSSESHKGGIAGFGVGPASLGGVAATALIKAVPKFEGEMLVMKKVSRLQMGSYLCIASNNVPPSISKRIHLKVHFPPVAWVPQQLEGAYVGQELVIECHTEAFPMSINYWTNNNGDMIVTGERLEATVAKNSYKAYMTLRIKRVIPEDFGVFRCIAKNSLGETDGAIKVYELEPPPTFNTNLLDYEKEIFEGDSGLSGVPGIPGGSSTPSHKQRNKMDEIRKGANEITDPDQRAKDGRKGKTHSQNGNRRHPTNSLFGIPDSSASYFWNRIQLFLIAAFSIVVKVLLNLQADF